MYTWMSRYQCYIIYVTNVPLWKPKLIENGRRKLVMAGGGEGLGRRGLSKNNIKIQNLIFEVLF